VLKANMKTGFFTASAPLQTLNYFKDVKSSIPHGSKSPLCHSNITVMNVQGQSFD